MIPGEEIGVVWVVAGEGGGGEAGIPNKKQFALWRSFGY